MTSFTHKLWNAVCVKVAYLVCSRGVLSFQTLKLMFCIINNPGLAQACFEQLSLEFKCNWKTQYY